MRRAWVGWLILAGYIAWWDSHCETLSDGFAHCLFDKRRRPIVVVIWLIVSLHLFRRLPKRIDPFYYASKLKR